MPVASVSGSPCGKSLGSKRREITDEAREEIVKIYHELLNGEVGWGEFSKIFSTTEFGYREIRIERPLKLNFECREERLELLKTRKKPLSSYRMINQQETAASTWHTAKAAIQKP